MSHFFTKANLKHVGRTNSHAPFCGFDIYLYLCSALGGLAPSIAMETLGHQPLKGNQVEDLNCPAAVSSPYQRGQTRKPLTAKVGKAFVLGLQVRRPAPCASLQGERVSIPRCKEE